METTDYSMQLEGRKVHIAGSASETTPVGLLTYAHNLVAETVSELVRGGATFVVGVGSEPRAADSGGEQPIVFDWTVMETVKDRISKWEPSAAEVPKPLILTIATARTDMQIPDRRRELWNELLNGGFIQLLGTEMEWASGAVRRTSLAEHGDILIALSGGEGVEHLAQLYAFGGKPVIPFDLDIGSSSNDGSGGAASLARRMKAHPERFITLNDNTKAGALLARMSTRQGKADVSEAVTGLVQLLNESTAPGAFYVRLLNKTVEQYPEVESFFRNVVDPFVSFLGFRPIEMGTSEVLNPIIHEDIFSQLHQSPLVIADLTGLRADCLIELGYAMGRNRKIILSAMEGTKLTFDTTPIDCHFWSPSDDNQKRQDALRQHWRRVQNRPSIHEPIAVL